jgi:8-oxo-dGTP diphosphatase
MVRHVHDECDYWTLPGGAVEPGETAAQAARREVLEETAIRLTEVVQLYQDGHATCFFATCSPDQEPRVGFDPELVGRTQMIKDAQWFSLEEKRDDIQVSKVIDRLRKLGR